MTVSPSPLCRDARLSAAPTSRPSMHACGRSAENAATDAALDALPEAVPALVDAPREDDVQSSALIGDSIAAARLEPTLWIPVRRVVVPPRRSGSSARSGRRRHVRYHTLHVHASLAPGSAPRGAQRGAHFCDGQSSQSGRTSRGLS